MKKSALLIIAVVGAVLGACNSSENKNQQQVKQSQQRPQVTAQQPPADSTHLIGVWYDEELKTDKGEHIAYELLHKGKKTYIQVITFTGKKLNVNDNPDLAPSATELKKSGEKYISIERPNEMYSVDKQSNLLVFDETGLVMKCKRML